MTDYFGAMGTALYSKLAAGTALIAELGGTFIYDTLAPKEQAYPFVLFSHQAGGPQRLTPGGQWLDAWYVRAWSANKAQAARLDKLCYELLDGKTLTVSGFTNFDTARVENIALVETEPNTEYVYSYGGIYDVRLS
jgi:hypothetical protein